MYRKLRYCVVLPPRAGWDRCLEIYDFAIFLHLRAGGGVNSGDIFDTFSTSAQGVVQLTCGGLVMSCIYASMRGAECGGTVIIIMRFG